MFVIELGSGGQIQIHARKTSDRFQTSKSDPSEPLKSIEDFCPCLWSTVLWEDVKEKMLFMVEMHERLEILYLTAASIIVFVFWNIPPRNLVVCGRFRSFCCFHHRFNGGSKHFWNVNKLLLDYWRNNPAYSRLHLWTSSVTLLQRAHLAVAVLRHWGRHIGWLQEASVIGRSLGIFSVAKFVPVKKMTLFSEFWATFVFEGLRQRSNQHILWLLHLNLVGKERSFIIFTAVVFELERELQKFQHFLLQQRFNLKRCQYIFHHLFRRSAILSWTLGKYEST